MKLEASFLLEIEIQQRHPQFTVTCGACGEPLYLCEEYADVPEEQSRVVANAFDAVRMHDCPVRG